MIYLDNAATTIRKPEPVIQAVAEAMRSMGNAGRGSHEASLDAARILFRTREKLAELFGADAPECVAFTANSTESLNMAVKGTLSPGDHVITTVMEHNSVLRPLYQMEELGIQLTILPLHDGQIGPEDFEPAVRKNTKAVICTHASNLTGDMIDLAGVGRICRQHNLLFIVDASQTAGIFPIDMENMGIDILCFTGHKSMMGPQGIGGICVRRGLTVRPLVVGGSGIRTFSRKHPECMPQALEAGTVNSHGAAGLYAALLYQENIGRDVIMKKELFLADMLYKGLSSIKGVTVYGNFTKSVRAPIVAVNLYDLDSAFVSDELAVRYEIMTRPGGHCAPLFHEALGTKEQGAVRFSISWQNTEEEVMEAVKAVKELAEEI